MNNKKPKFSKVSQAHLNLFPLLQENAVISAGIQAIDTSGFLPLTRIENLSMTGDYRQPFHLVRQLLDRFIT